MHNSYTTSIRCTSSKSYYSVSDYTSYIHGTNPNYLPFQSCCPCCANSLTKSTVNPTFLYGLRQSRLITYHPPRKIIISGMVHSYPRFPVCDTEPNCNYIRSHLCEDRISSGTRGRWRKGGFGDLIDEEWGKSFKSRNAVADDAELILSLLSEEVCDDFSDTRERDRSLARISQVEKREKRGKRKNDSSKCNSRLVESGSSVGDRRYTEAERNKQEKKRENEFRRERKGESSCSFVRNKQEKEKEKEFRRVRKGESSCSSYYSLSSLEGIESDNEVQNKEDEVEIVRESLSECNRNQNIESEEQTTSGRNEKQEIRLEKKDSGSSRVEFDWRKKSEKKLADVLVEQEESRNESSQKLFSSSAMNKDYNAQKRENKLSSVLRIDEEKRENFSAIRNDVTRQSELKLKYDQARETKQINSSVDKASSSSDKQYRVGVDSRVDDYEVLEDNIQQQLSKTSEIQETRSSDFNNNRIEQGESDQLVTKRTNLRRKSKVTEISVTNDANTEDIIYSEGRSNLRVKNPDEASSSFQESKKQHTQFDTEPKKQHTQIGAKSAVSLKSGKESHIIITDAENVSKSGHNIKSSSQEERLTSSTSSQLDSADKSEKFASHFINEFVEKANDEISTSGKQDKQTGQLGGQLGSNDSEPKERDSRRSSRSSGAKGPSDEMWALNNTSLTIDKPSQTEGPEDSNKVVRKSGRSMWGVMSDIVRLRWGPRSETRSSPIASTSSDAYYSGMEQGGSQSQHETSSDGDQLLSKGKSISSIEETSVEPLEESLGSQITRPTTPIPAAEGNSIESVKGRLGTQITRPTTPIPATEETSIVPVKDRLGTQTTRPTASMPATEETSAEPLKSSLGTRITRPIALMPATGEISAENLKGNLGSQITRPTAPLPAMRMRRSPPVREEIVSAEVKEVSGTESNEEQVKRTKLQRSKQLPKDRFDEWEEAFVVENEQRKMDEMFMKEALLGAKKAGDMWEVPVGAVLVHHGEIIARGYNLVEELRDSTAHAEMNCIREASNVLQSWRLSETTLYVTLEPCPMCAGAILQARVDTVVWGAPNKLLGADGSWIRLFPSGGEEGSDTVSAPVHPFHPKMKVRRGVLSSECANVMQEFFQFRRKKESKTETPPPSSLHITNNSSKLFTKMHHVFHSLFCL